MRPVDNSSVSLGGPVSLGGKVRQVASPAPLTPARQPGQEPADGTPAVAVTLSGHLAGGQAPVEAERVDQIRKAIETGTYPILPATIADAMIAASLLLRSGE